MPRPLPKAVPAAAELPPRLRRAAEAVGAHLRSAASKAALSAILEEVARHVRPADALAASEVGPISPSAKVRHEAMHDPIVGAGPGGGLDHVMQRVNMVARQSVPVLLLGETGSGKEVIARAIHSGSRRATRPFVRVNCGAIPRDLIDSELFGHEKGAFTGATDRRRGWFEQADAGTLLLDEIGELPLEAQVRLLRILQDGTFKRVGGHETITVDVRIVAATHRDLPAMVDRGQFREDLWYRIATFPIRVPPLRERPGDVPELARQFIRKASIRFGLAEAPLDARSLGLLQSYAWPGNVRELGAVLDRAVILGDGHRLEVAAALGQGLRAPATTQLPETISAGSPIAADAGRVAPRPDRAAPGKPGNTLDDAMRRHIESALEASFGRVDGPFGAAAALGINPHTLRSRMRKLAVDWKRFRRSDQA